MEEILNAPVGSFCIPFLNTSCTITITLHGFSSCSGMEILENAEYEYEDGDDSFMEHYCPVPWVEDSSSGNERYVSIIFNPNRSTNVELNFISVEFRCTASAIDASGDKRYPQILSYVSDLDIAGREICLDKFIKRSFLLNNSSELLPGDTLTVCLDIDWGYQCRNWKSLNDNDLGHYVNNEGEWYINMDSPHGQNLCKLSPVFQRMMETPMVERTTRLFHLSPDERDCSALIYLILKRDEFFFTSIGEITKLYEFADRYFMEHIIKKSRDFMMSVLLTINSIRALNIVRYDIQKLSELVERFNKDDNLKEILMVYSDIERKFQGGKTELEVSNISKMETEWICEYKEKYFQFSRNESECIQMDCFK